MCDAPFIFLLFAHVTHRDPYVKLDALDRECPLFSAFVREGALFAHKSRHGQSKESRILVICDRIFSCAAYQHMKLVHGDFGSYGGLF